MTDINYVIALCIVYRIVHCELEPMKIIEPLITTPRIGYRKLALYISTEI